MQTSKIHRKHSSPLIFFSLTNNSNNNIDMIPWVLSSVHDCFNDFARIITLYVEGFIILILQINKPRLYK